MSDTITLCRAKGTQEFWVTEFELILFPILKKVII